MRVNSFVYVPKILPGIRNQLMHVSDLLPTLADIVGFKIDYKIDGISQWGMIKSNIDPPRNEVVNLDNIAGFGSLIQERYKFVNGSALTGMFDGWLSSKNYYWFDNFNTYITKVLRSKAFQALTKVTNLPLNFFDILMKREKLKVVCSKKYFKTSCDPLKAPCLFDIIEDPCEQNNLANSDYFKNIFNSMKKRFSDIVNSAVPSARKPPDSACDPRNFNDTWTYWQGE